MAAPNIIPSGEKIPVRILSKSMGMRGFPDAGVSRYGIDVVENGVHVKRRCPAGLSR